MKLKPLVCPECKGPLEKRENILVCQNCKENYTVRSGIPDFVGSFEYWGEISPWNMKKLLDTAHKEGYLSALSEFVIENERLGRYLLSSLRSDWIFHCLTTEKSKTCLDTGSGWGTLSRSLLNYFDEVWSLEAVWERIKFQEIVKNQAKLNGLNLVRSLAHKLPFADNYFDLVVANGMLEWVSLGDIYKNPMEVQLDFLNETYRVLKDGGCLYIGIENRIGYRNFLGERDHSGLPFTSILPRRLSSLVVSLASSAYKKRLYRKKVSAYRTYTYTLPGYLKLLRKAGFSQVDFYWTSNYNYPKFSGNVSDSSALNFYLKAKRAWRIRGKPFKLRDKVYLSLPEGLQKILFTVGIQLFPFFLIFAYKGQKGQTLESQLLKRVSTEKMSFLRVSGGDYDDSNIMYFLVDTATNDLHSVVKIPRFWQGSKVLNEKEKRLSVFNDFSFKTTRLEGTPVYIEKKIPHTRMEILNPSHNFLALKWLINFQNKTEKGFLSSEDLDSDCSLLTEYLSLTKLDSKVKRKVRGDLMQLSSHLDAKKVPKTSEHGDYCAANILIKGRNVFVVDWEDYKDSGNPLFDFGFFVITNSKSTESSVYESFYKNFTGKGQYSNILKQIARRFLNEKNLETETLNLVIPYTLVRFIRDHDPRFQRWKYNFAVFHRLLESWYKRNKEINEFLLSETK